MHILGIDVGGSGVKAGVVDVDKAPNVMPPPPSGNGNT